MMPLVSEFRATPPQYKAKVFLKPCNRQSLSECYSVHAPKISSAESKLKQGNKPWKWEKEEDCKQSEYMIKGNNQEDFR